MNKRLGILIIFIWICKIGFSQDFKFNWQACPSLAGNAYTILVEKKNNESYITIKEIGATDSIFKKLSIKDCKTLAEFLNKYTYPIKANINYGPKSREYYETKVLPDTNWIQIKGDSLRRELLWVLGYSFDKKSNKCYTEVQSMDYWTDGNTYKGEYVKSNLKRTFSVYCARISDMDFQLNNMIYNLITSYDHEGDYSQLKKMIESDKPRENN